MNKTNDLKTKAAEADIDMEVAAAQEDAIEPQTIAEVPAEEHSPGERLILVLEAVATSREPVAAADLAPRLGLSRATAHRLCVALERLGFLERELGGKRFVSGYRQQHVALNSLFNASYRGARHAVLQALAEEVSETVNVTVLDGNQVVYIDRVECQWPLRIHLQPGNRVPLHCGASGKLFLSMMPAAKRRQLLAAPLQRYTDKSITDVGELEAHLKTIRAAKVSIDVEEFMHGLIGVAVPVLDRNGRICATVSLHAPTARHTVEGVQAFVPAMQRSATAISKLMNAELSSR